MRTLYKYISVFLLTSVLLVSCEKDFDEINTSPNSPDKAQSQFLLTYAQRQFAYAIYDSWFSGRMASVASQQWAQRNYTTEDRYEFRANVTNNYFRNLYFYLMNLEEVIRLNTDAATKAEMANVSGDNNAQIATAMILRAAIIQMMTDCWGAIPYSQAFKPIQYPTPAYDSQADIYTALIAELDQAATLIGTTTSAWDAGGDIIYGGDMTKWKKFANSLRLRLAVRMNRVNPATANTVALDAIADGVFTSNDDNAVFNFIKDGTPNAAPMYEAFFTSARNDFSMTKQFVNLMRGLNDPDIRTGGYTNPFAGISDPRLPIYRGPAMDNTTIGLPFGLADEDMKGYVNANPNVINYFTSPVAKVVAADFGSIFLDYPTVCFMRSEVTNWDRTWFSNGVEASCEMWGVSAANTTAYHTAVMAAYDAAPVAQREELVITQKYIHLFTQSHEAWSEYRRTGFPRSIVKPNEVTLIDGATTYRFVPLVSSGTDIVARFMYPSSEFTLNKDNVNAAITAQGADNLSTRLWWDIN